MWPKQVLPDLKSIKYRKLFDAFATLFLRKFKVYLIRY